MSEVEQAQAGASRIVVNGDPGGIERAAVVHDRLAHRHPRVLDAGEPQRDGPLVPVVAPRQACVSHRAQRARVDVKELEQTRRYLTIEKARFGADRIVEAEHVDGRIGELLVPSFLIQPIVENAVRHAMRDDAPLNIDIHAVEDGDDVLLAVADDGLGMTEEAAHRLLDPDAGAAGPVGSGKKKGAGMALKNVMERVERFYDAGSGVEVVSRPGEGTCVTLRLCGAAKRLVLSNDVE